jgi:hypothetical protein
MEYTDRANAYSSVVILSLMEDGIILILSIGVVDSFGEIRRSQSGYLYIQVRFESLQPLQY